MCGSTPDHICGFKSQFKIKFKYADWTVRVEVCWGQTPPHLCLLPPLTTPSPQ